MPDAVEVRAGSDPNQPDGDVDSDGDGLTNQAEQKLGTRPDRADTDDDGLADGAEGPAGTDPLRADTDGDSLNDGREVQLGTNPLVMDTDGDSLSDGQEDRLGTSPLKVDTDGDSLSDATELAYPTICVAQQASAQRPTAPPLRTESTPPPACSATSDCLAGETCRGLNPTQPDSDGDGLTDGQEDSGSDGQIRLLAGDTDPRLFDTDGDGVGDSTAGAALCKPSAALQPASKAIGAIQLATLPGQGTVTAIGGTTAGVSAVTVDDVAGEVASLIVAAPTKGSDARADQAAFEMLLQQAAGSAMPIVRFWPFTSPEGLPGMRSSYRIVMGSVTSASAVRDLVVPKLTGGTAPTGSPVGAGQVNFYIDLATVRRSATLDQVIVTVAPEASYNDDARVTAARVEDMIHTTALSDGSRSLDSQCQILPASATGSVDFVWTVDVSMDMDAKQALIANTTPALISRVRSAGVDLRVGVFSAEGNPANPIDLANTGFPGFPNGFEFIQGSAANADRLLCRQVTSTVSGAAGFCPADMSAANDSINPFGINTTMAEEEPVAAGVRVHDLLKKNMSNGTANANWQFRKGAIKALLFVTDEPLTPMFPDINDYSRYFQNAVNPDNGQRFSPAGVYDATTLSNIVDYFKNNQVLTYGMLPAQINRPCNIMYDARDLHRCVVEGNGGAVADILSQQAPLYRSALERMMIDAVGRAGPVALPRSPISSTLQVNVRGKLVPRSRSNGFDYDPRAKTLVFYGTTYRPTAGDPVYVSYRAWSGVSG